MGIKEIALRIGEEADEYADAKLQSKGEFHPDWHTVRDEYFAEALIESYKSELLKEVGEPVFVVFDGPPGPDSGRFIEVETKDRFSVMAGDWENHIPDYWRLGPLFTSYQVAAAILKATKPLEDQLAKAERRIAELIVELEHTRKQKNLLWFEFSIATQKLAAAQEEIANETAEACAELAYAELDDPFLSGHGYANRVSEAIRSGEWRKFMKGELDEES